MRNSKAKTTGESPQIFTVWSDEVISGGRLDAKYWIPAIRELQEAIQNGKYKSQKLGDFITDIRYGVSTTNEYVDVGIRLLRILNLKDEGLDLSDVVYLPEEARAEIGRAFVHEGDMLISRSGSVGIVVVVPKEAEGFAFGSFMIRFTLNDKINKQYVAAWLNSEASRKLIEREKIGAIQGNITIETIKNFDIPFPPLSVQKEVVEKIQAAYDEKRKKEEEIKKILASIDGFVLGELGISVEGEHERERVSERAPEIYVTWSDEIERRIDPNFYRPYYQKLLRAIEVKNNARLGELVELSNETWDHNTIFADTFPYIEISAIDLKTGDIAGIEQIPITDAPSRAKMLVRQGDIIVSTTRPNRGAIAKIEKEQDGSIASTGFAVLREMKTNKISKDFLFVMLRSILSLKQMEQRTTGGNYPAITPEDLKQIWIVLPDKVKQEKIISGVQSSYSKMRTLRAQAAEVLAGAQKQVEQMILA